MLDHARDEGLRHVDLTTEPHNIASQRVIEKNGGVLIRPFIAPPMYGHKHGLLFRIPL
jgi:predicted acetyltransferase